MAKGRVWVPQRRGVVDWAVRPYLAHRDWPWPAPLLIEVRDCVVTHVSWLGSQPIEAEPDTLLIGIARERIGAEGVVVPDLPEHLWRQEYEQHWPSSSDAEFRAAWGQFPPLKEEPHA